MPLVFESGSTRSFCLVFTSFVRVDHIDNVCDNTPHFEAQNVRWIRGRKSILSWRQQLTIQKLPEDPEVSTIKLNLNEHFSPEQ